MTDIGNWPELVYKHSYYVVVPLNEYQIANVLDAMVQAVDNGDWFGEMQDILGLAMLRAGIEKCTSNNGRTFTREQVQNRAIKEGWRGRHLTAREKMLNLAASFEEPDCTDDDRWVAAKLREIAG